MFFDRDDSYVSNCNAIGSKLFETNLEVKNNLLKIFNSNISEIKEFINLYFKKIYNAVDKYSLYALKSQKKILIDSINCNKLIKHLTDYQIKNHKRYVKELSIYKRMYNLKYYTEEVFYYHHGLRFCNKKILRYIYNKNIIDVGSSFGDSLLILQNYTNKIIHLFDLSKKNIQQLKENIELNHIQADRYVIHEKGLSNFTGDIVISDNGDGGVGIGKHKSNKVKVNITTLDNEFLNQNIDIGFIKVDVEGQGYNFVNGAKRIIHLNRPVINMGIYHNYDEYFRVRYLLEDIVNKYNYEYHQHNNCEPWACEFDLFAYPSEILLN